MPVMEMRPSHQRTEKLKTRIILQQLTALQIEVPAVQNKFSALHGLLHPWKGEQIVEREPYAPQFAGAGAIRSAGSAHGRIGLLKRLPGYRHPCPDELITFPVLISGNQSMDTSAAGMSHDNDIMYLQVLDCILQGRAHPVTAAVGSVGRNQIGHVAYNEKITGTTVGKKNGIYTGITAGDDQSERFLSVPEFFEQRLLRVIPPALEATKAGRKTNDQRTLMMGGTMCTNNMKRHHALDKQRKIQERKDTLFLPYIPGKNKNRSLTIEKIPGYVKQQRKGE